MNANAPLRDHDRAAPSRQFVANIVETPEGLADLAPAWRSLESEQLLGPTFFQTFAFAEAAFHHCAPARPMIGTVQDGAGRVVLIAPLQVSRRRGLNTAGWLGGGVNARGDGIVAPGCDVATAMTALRAKLIQRGDVDALELRYVSQAAALGPWLLAHCHGRIEQGRSPILDLAAAGSFAALEADRISKAQRQQNRRKRRRLADSGELRLVREAASPAASEMLKLGLEMKRAWVRVRSEASVMLSDPVADALLHRCAATHPGFECHGLFVGETMIAFTAGLRGPRRLHYLLTAFDPVHLKHSPGVMLLEDLLARWAADGIAEVDFGNGMNAYKLDWTDHSLANEDYANGLSLAGQIHARIIKGAIEPTLRKAYWAVPENVRRVLRKILLWT